MQYKFFTFPVAPSSEQEEELNSFLRSHRVLSVDKELSHNAIKPFNKKKQPLRSAVDHYNVLIFN